MQTKLLVMDESVKSSESKGQNKHKQAMHQQTDLISFESSASFLDFNQFLQQEFFVFVLFCFVLFFGHEAMTPMSKAASCHYLVNLDELAPIRLGCEQLS